MTALLVAAAALVVRAQAREPIVYTVRMSAPETHFIEVEAAIPTAGRPTVDLMMAVWSPGYYREENYADRVDQVSARAGDGAAVNVEKTARNRWRIETGGRQTVVLSYRVFCYQRSVTTNYVGDDYAVLNGAPSFITLVEAGARPHEVHLELPSRWPRAMSGLGAAPDGRPTHFRAADYETLVDSPILAGDLGVQEFTVAGKPHYVVSAGDTAGWDAAAASRSLATYVEEVNRFWGFLPYDKYDFLLVFRQGGGGLEHKNSTLSTVAARPGPGLWSGVGLLSHEYFHLFNVKRLRPVELGPFDFEHPPRTGNLWIAEGVTSYYSSLLVERAGLHTRTEYLASLSTLIGRLQSAPGRLQQSVEQSSLDVWNNSNSGVNPNAATVSYYDKGQILGLLLDAKIRRETFGQKSFDDVMKRAYERYGGARGYTSDEFRGVAEEVAGTNLREWFRRSVSSTEELEYDDLIESYGLGFKGGEVPADRWTLVFRDNATAPQLRNRDAWLGRSPGR